MRNVSPTLGADAAIYPVFCGESPSNTPPSIPNKSSLNCLRSDSSNCNPFRHTRSKWEILSQEDSVKGANPSTQNSASINGPSSQDQVLPWYSVRCCSSKSSIRRP